MVGSFSPPFSAPVHRGRLCGAGLAGLLFVLTLGTAAPQPAPRPTLRAGVETHSEPATFADTSGHAAGFAVELLRAIAREQKLEIEFVVLDWPDLLAEFKAGRLDLICNVVDTPDRAAYMDFSATTLLMQGRVFTRRDAPPIRNFNDLAGRRLATARDARAHEYARHQGWKVDFVFRNNLLDCVEAVHNGQADVLLATHLVTQHHLRRLGYREIVPTELQFPDFDYHEHFAVQKGQAALLAQLNEGLLAVTRTGLYDALYEQWLGPITPRPLRWRDVQYYVIAGIVVLALGLGALAWQRRLLRRVRQQAEELRRSEERLQLVFEGTQDGFWDWDLHTATIFRSARWATMLGYEPAEIPPTLPAFHQLVHPDDLPRVLTDEAEIVAGQREHHSIEFRLRAKSGQWRWILDRGKVIARDPATGTPTRWTGTHTDITPQKLAAEQTEQIERKMLETQKLESLGVLAGGIAHDFNNLLTVILGNTALTQLDLPADSESSTRLAQTQVAAHRAADLCRQLLAYAGKGAFVNEPLDLNTLARDTTRLLEIPRGSARLEFALASTRLFIEGDPSQIRQIIMNLVLNAAEAVAGRPDGCIRIATSETHLAAGALPDALPAGELPAGPYHCLAVTDNGCGMTPDVLGRIFDPFFTTKFTGRGLGLAAVLGIVRSHHGALTVHSSPGQGTDFRIYLPAIPPTATPPTAYASPAPATPDRATVLLADDEPPVLDLGLVLLRQLGCTPVPARDGREALALFTANPAHFDAVVLDITMPYLDGLTALARMREIRPDLPGVILSGHSVHETRDRSGMPNVEFLQKPFAFEALAAALRRVRQRL